MRIRWVSIGKAGNSSRVGVRAWPFLPVDIWSRCHRDCSVAAVRRCDLASNEQPTGLPTTQPARFAEAGFYFGESDDLYGAICCFGRHGLHRLRGGSRHRPWPCMGSRCNLLRCGSMAGAIMVSLKRYIIICLRGTSSVPVNVDVQAPNLTDAMNACRAQGYWPVQHCLAHAA